MPYLPGGEAGEALELGEVGRDVQEAHGALGGLQHGGNDRLVLDRVEGACRVHQPPADLHPGDAVTPQPRGPRSQVPRSRSRLVFVMLAKRKGGTGAVVSQSKAMTGKIALDQGSAALGAACEAAYDGTGPPGPRPIWTAAGGQS